nr:circumsporozoite protein-like [Aegilops tauschii subsp. strangulata]
MPTGCMGRPLLLGTPTPAVTVAPVRRQELGLVLRRLVPSGRALADGPRPGSEPGGRGRGCDPADAWGKGNADGRSANPPQGVGSGCGSQSDPASGLPGSGGPPALGSGGPPASASAGGRRWRATVGGPPPAAGRPGMDEADPAARQDPFWGCHRVAPLGMAGAADVGGDSKVEREGGLAVGGVGARDGKQEQVALSRCGWERFRNGETLGRPY